MNATPEEAAALERVQALYAEARAIEARCVAARTQLADDQEYARQAAETALAFYLRPDVQVLVIERSTGAGGGESTTFVPSLAHPAVDYFRRRGG